MRTRVWTVDPAHPDPDALREAGTLLRDGRLVAFPTETVYGLGANALDAGAVARIYTAKGRPAHNPIIVHLADVADLPSVARDIPPLAHALAARFWPGPLTLVLPRGEAVPDIVTAGGPTVAVRVPAHPVARALIRAAGVPLAAPSANRSGMISPTRAEHVLLGLDGLIDGLIDAGPATGGLESTVFDVTCDPPRLLRPGLISSAELATIASHQIATVSHAESQPLASPGLLTKHYAPRTPVTLLEREQVPAETDLQLGWLVVAPVREWPSVPHVLTLPDDPVQAASGLYEALHALDALRLERIVIVQPPDIPAWLTIRDRLRRAGA